MLPGWRNPVPRETGNLVPFGSLGSKQLLAKLACMADICLKAKSTAFASLASALKVRVGPSQPNGNPFDMLCDIQLR